MRRWDVARMRQVALVWVAVGATALGVCLAGAMAARADGTDIPMHLVGYVQTSDLHGGGVNFPVGIDDGWGDAIYYSTAGLVNLLDIATLKPDTQTASISTRPFTGRLVADAYDPLVHRAYLAKALPSEASCPVAAVCQPAGYPAPQVESVDLKTRTASSYTFPESTGGQDVVALASADPPGRGPVVFALLYTDAAGPSSNQRGFGPHSLTLYALDATKMAAPQADPADAVLWSYSVDTCASLLSWSQQKKEFLGVDPQGRFAYFGCQGMHTDPNGSGGYAASPPGAVVVGFPPTTPFPAQKSTAGFTTTFYPTGANVQFAATGGDSASHLFYLATINAGAPDFLRVFDAAHRAWTGTVQFEGQGNNIAGVSTDPSTGRAYVAWQESFLLASDVTQLPAGQGIHLTVPMVGGNDWAGPLLDPATHRIFLPFVPSGAPTGARFTVMRDPRPAPPVPVPADPDAFTHDIPVTEDTPVGYRVFASGYGAKEIVYGESGVAPVGGGSPLQFATREASTCSTALEAAPVCTNMPALPEGTRSFTFGQVSGVETSSNAVTADASPLTIDSGTAGNAATLRSVDPLSAVFGLPPPPDGVDQARKQTNDQTNAANGQVNERTNSQVGPAACADLGGKPHQMTQPMAAVSCDYDGRLATAAAAAGACLGSTPAGTQAGICTASAPAGTPSLASASWPSVELGYAGSATQTLLAPTGGSVATTVALARGVLIAIPGGTTVSIGEVRAIARSIAAGRPGTAVSTYKSSLSDVVVTDPSGAIAFACGFDGVVVAGAAQSSPNCDPRALTEVVSAHAPSPVEFLTPGRDESPGVAGSPGGAVAEVTKDPYRYLNDYLVDGDDGKEVPALQVVMVGDQLQPSRLTLELASVRVESHYEIGTAPVRTVLPLPSLELSLLDDATPPVGLSGATFTLQGPGDAAPLTCLTAADGIGSCTFAKLPPGSYTISEPTAPPGFAPVKDYPLTLEAGKNYKTSFVNLPAIGAVKVNLSAPGDEAKPIEGGVFAMFKGDDVLGTPVATCTTDAEGGCGFDKVPLGKYTMSQVSAPEGYLVTDDVAFELAQPRQTVTVTFVDGTPEIAAKPPTVIPGKPAVPAKVIPGKPAVPAKVIPGKPGSAPRTMVLPALGGTGTAGLDALEPASYDTSGVPAPVVSSQNSDAMGPLSLGGGLTGLPVRLARLALHTPQQAVLLLFVWLILGMPVYLWVRRRQFITATEGI